jgi:hypothetical protein
MVLTLSGSFCPHGMKLIVVLYLSVCGSGSVRYMNGSNVIETCVPCPG